MTPSSSSAHNAALLALLLEQDAEHAAAPATAAGDHADAPLSFSQQRLWFLLQYEPDSTAYNQTRAFVLRGALDRAALDAALRAVVARHPALRTRFVANDDVPGAPPRQIVQSAPGFALTQAPLAAGDEALQACIDAEAARPFELSRAPLLRATLLTRAADDHVLLLSLHHIVSDAVSNAIIARDLAMAYGQAAAGDTVRLPSPTATFAAHARQQRERLQDGALDRQREWWQRQLGSHVPALQLPTDTPHGARPEKRIARRVRTRLPQPLAAQLRAFCTAQRCTPFVALFAAWQALLSRYTGQHDFAVGVPHAGRDGAGLDDVVGFFANTHVYRSRTAPGITARALCEQLRADALGALTHAELPFEVLLDSMQLARDAARSPLFQVMFNLRAGTDATRLALPGLCTEAVEARETGAKFDLILDVQTRADAVLIELEYDCTLFGPAIAQRMLRHYVAQLTGMLQAPELPLTATPLLGADADGHAALAHQQTVGRPQRRIADPELAHRMIQRQAEQRPNAIALRFGEITVSYGELERRANRLAHQLIGLGVGPEVRVGIAAERSPEMIVGLLAILKAGGAYVPFDPAYPAERLAYLFEDSGIAALLTQPALRGLLPQREGLPVLMLDDQHGERHGPDHPPAVDVRADHLAYVIYTSGSTGRPKGAQLQHGNLSRLLAATQHWFGFGPDDVWTLFHSYAFDFSVWEIFGALCHGGQLVIVPFLVSRAPQEFLALLRRERVTVLNQTPSAFRALMAQPEIYDEPPALRYVIFGGEALEPQALRPWLAHFGDASPRLINMYGITETTVHVTYRPITQADLDPASGARSPIGERIPDLGVRVLDPGLNLVPPGVAGELYIGGDGLARGYLNRPGLTAERFVPDPFAGDGSRLYRTGDLARWLPDGQLEYLGRIDQQLKIRGFRIEPGEIEARILAQPGLANAAVLAIEGPSGARLVAYVVPAADAQLEVARLRAALAAELPDYMVPAAFVVLDALPLTPNGKLDRRALPAPATEAAEHHVPPRTEAQRWLAQVWQEVLGVEQVGLDDNFFALGGDSLLSLKVISRVRANKALGLDLKLRDLMRTPTIGQLLPDDGQPATPATPAAALRVLAQGPAGGALPPIACVHAALGTLFDYDTIVARLGKQRTVYGFQARALADPAWRDGSLASIASDYVREWRAAQPQGPYLLLGWSLGATLATLMAHELEARGQQVQWLGLVDPFVPERHHSGGDRAPTWPAALAAFAHQMLPGAGPIDMPARPNPEPDADTVRALLAPLVTSAAGPQAALGADELTQMFVAAHRLGTLAAGQSALPPVRAPRTVWWRAGRDGAAARLAGWQGPPRDEFVLDGVDHHAIVRDPRLLAVLESCVAPRPAADTNGQNDEMRTVTLPT